MSLPASVQRKLTALTCPTAPQEVDLNDDQAFCRLVLWLEEEKIRLLPQVERKKLRNFEGDAMYEWEEVFRKYCKDLNASTTAALDATDFLYSGNDPNSPLRISLVNRLASLAMQDVYIDKKEDATGSSSPAAAKEETASVQQQTSLDNILQLTAAINPLLSNLGLPSLPTTSEEVNKGQHTSKDLEAMALSALTAVSARAQDQECKQSNPPNFSVYPVGFEPAAELRDIAVVLRLLHGRELRGMQDKINDVIVRLQHLTADPKTDTRLGRVGR